MARINASESTSIMRIKAFLGLNENPDGDTKIRDGELAEMRNFKITRDRHLQVRPGTKTVLALRAAWDAWAEEHTAPTPSPVFGGAWEGMAGNARHMLCAFGGLIFDIAADFTTAEVVGQCTQDATHFFGFGGKVYLLNGHEYMSWGGGAGESFAAVEGYIPTVMTAMTPAGSGTLLENLNRLTGKRRVTYSPDGEATEFFLPEKAADEILSVEGTEIAYTSDAENGKLIFESAPARGTNTVTVTYRKGTGARGDVEKMRFSELFNGANDTRVFLYGDGSNRTLYSGIDADGVPTADYFPDLYEISIGESNTPITALVRHYARMIAFKSGSAWSVQYGTMSLNNSVTTAAFYVTPLNRSIGNEAPGQALLLENNPLTLETGGVYQWQATSSSGYITDNQTNAKRVSDRVFETVRGFAPERTRTFNRKNEHEFWVLSDGTALILNYASDAWYIYTNMPFLAMLDSGGETYGFTADGKIKHLSRAYRNDDGTEIDAYAASGLMDFGRDWQLKYSPMLFVAIEPEVNARITVTAESNRRSDYPNKVVAMNIAAFNHVDFNHFSFRTNHKAQVKRLKMKVKKATFYRLVFKSVSASATATVLETDIQLRYAGNVK